MLADFLRTFHIDVPALKRIQNRVFIVGRFRLSGEDDPQVFLFTNRTDLSDGYLKNFDGTYGMSYENFVRAIRPAIAERVFKDARFPHVVQVVPQEGDDLEGTSVIDLYNWFFQRAVANSEQEAIRDQRPGLQLNLLEGDDPRRGKAILIQIRKNLQTFCAFQPRTHELIRAMARLLDDCTGDAQLPVTFAPGAPLPDGFAEAFVDFLYAEDTSIPFAVDRLDFSRGHWAAVARNKRAKEAFCAAAGAFREALLGGRAAQYSGLKFKGESLGRLARKALEGHEDLQRDFIQARDAFNGLRQILRSKVLLSMILEWVLSAYYRPDILKDIPQGGDHQFNRDRAVEKAILDDWQKFGLAPPVKRPSPEERAAFARALTDNFERLLRAILAADPELADRCKDLPAGLLDLVREVRADPARATALRAIAGEGLSNDLARAFVDAARMILLDLLCPVLYRVPVLTVAQLRQLFRQETTAAYMTAILLADGSEEAVRRLAERHIDLFESKIDAITKQIRDKDELVSTLLRGFLEVLSAEDLRQRLTQGVQVLNEVYSLMEHTQIEGEPGASRVSAKFCYRAIAAQGADSAEQTSPCRGLIREVVPVKVRQALEHRLAVGISPATTSAGAESSNGNGASSAQRQRRHQPAHGEEPSPGNGASPTPQGANGPSLPVPVTRLERKIEEAFADAVVQEILTGWEPVATESVTEMRKQELVARVSAGILADERFVGGVADDLKAFEKALSLIYTRYSDSRHADKRQFRNQVERLTLINMMLLFQKDLGLGRVHSSLFHMLIDLIMHVDAEEPDPGQYMRERSLTLYFDEAALRDGGITALRKTLEGQAGTSLRNIVSFVSELRGVKYLMDTLKDHPEAEVIVINATADGFWEWVRQDNLVPGAGRGRLRSGKLVAGGEVPLSDSAIPPGLVYVTDIAFPEDDKVAWLRRLAEQPIREQGFSLVLPPLCLSTGAPHQGWGEQGRALAAAARDVPAPVVVVGPSPYLNRPGDGFPTILPSGYLFCAHFLSRPRQRIRTQNVAQESEARFRVIGFGSAPMEESLERVVWGEGEQDGYRFAADFYLYLLLTIEATAAGYGGPQQPDVAALYKCFHDRPDVFVKQDYHSSRLLDQAVLGGNALRFALDQEVPQELLQSVSVGMSPHGWLSDRNVPRLSTPDVTWFNLARERAGRASRVLQPAAPVGKQSG
jgi:hypothetical protein